MWTPLRIEIDRACRELGILQSDFSSVSIHDWPDIERRVVESFVESSGYSSPWLWEHFKQESHSIQIAEHPDVLLNLFLDPSELVWFFVNETVRERTKFWYYVGRVNAIQQVLGEVQGLSEYYLVSKKYEWLLCCNHHGVLIGTGDEMVKRMNR